MQMAQELRSASLLKHMLKRRTLALSKKPDTVLEALGNPKKDMAIEFP